MHDEELQAMLLADERHWWYRGRRSVLAAELDRLGLSRGRRALDAGCGSGRTLDALPGYAAVAGVDAAPAAVRLARARGHADVHVGRVEALPFDPASFDLVLCLDVLEHIPDDGSALRELRRVTEPGGHLVVTAPAYPALWSQHDVRNEHVRRYRRRDLLSVARGAGWDAVSSTHFNAVLLAPAAAVRLLRRSGRSATAAREDSDLSLTPGWLDPVLAGVLGAEAALLRRGARLPAGLSILAVFRARPKPVSR
jgi:SAM-dependent methyltransferase